MNKLFKILIFLLLFVGCDGTHDEYLYSPIQKIPVNNIKTNYTPYQNNSGFKYTYDLLDGDFKWKYITDITEEDYKITIYTNIHEFYLHGLKYKELYNKILKLKTVETEVYYKIITILTKDKDNNIIYRLTGYEFVDLDEKKYNISEVESE